MISRKLLALFPAPFLAGFRACEACYPFWHWWPEEWKPMPTRSRRPPYSLCNTDSHYIPLILYQRLPMPRIQAAAGVSRCPYYCTVFDAFDALESAVAALTADLDRSG